MTIVIEMPLSDRFSSLVKGLLTHVVALLPTGALPVPLVMRLWWRLRRTGARINAILERYDAGMLPAPAAAPRTPTPASARPAEAPARPRPPELPRRVGWFNPLISNGEAWDSEYVDVLREPRTRDALAGAPQLGGMLRSICRMLAVRQPSWLRLPRAPRPPRPRVVKQIPPAPDHVVTMPGAFSKPDGSIWMRQGASTKWRPGSGCTLEEAQKFDRPVRIWPHWEWK